MDEPLSNLDAKLRVATRSQIAALQRRLGVTTLYVTHDQVEAMTMGDRVAVMKDGLLQQVDAPRALYDSPVNAFVAGFIGSPAMNLIEGTLASDGVMIGSTLVAVPRALQTAAGAGPVTVGLRPEALELAGERRWDPGRRQPGRGVGLRGLRLLPARGEREGRHHRGARRDRASRPARRPQASGDKIDLHVKEGSMLLFDPESGARITGR